MTQMAWAKASSGAMRITGIVWIEHQNAFGKTARDDFNDDNTKYTMQDALDKLKRKVEEAAPIASQPTR